MEAAEYEALLDNYRGRCDECGRLNVLLEYRSDYDGMRTVCLLDTETCAALAAEQRKREGEAFQARLAAGDQQALATKATIDSFNSYYVDMALRKPVLTDPSKPRTMEWRRPGNFTGEKEGP